MPDASEKIKIKRRAIGGSAGAPSSLEQAEPAYNEQDNTLYIGVGTGGAGGTASEIRPIGGSGAFVDKNTNQSIDGVKTFNSTITGSVTGNAGTSTQLATPRDISLTGDISATVSGFDGSGNVSASATLPTVNSNVGSHTKVTVNAKGLVTAGSQASLSDLSAPTADLSANNFKVTNLAEPVAATDAATKNYVDNVAQGLNPKTAVEVATTANITLSGTQTIDGIALVVGDRVLVKNQTTQSENGIYVVSASTWSRSADANTWDELVSAYTFILRGTQEKQGWRCTAVKGGTLGSTSVVFEVFSGVTSYTAGTGLTLSGTQFSVSSTGVTAGNYGAASKTFTVTVNAQGQITSITESNIAIANTQVSGLGTMSTQAANNVNITGGTIGSNVVLDGVTIDGGTF